MDEGAQAAIRLLNDAALRFCGQQSGGCGARLYDIAAVRRLKAIDEGAPCTAQFFVSRASFARGDVIKPARHTA